MSWTLGGDPIPIPKNKVITRSIQTVLHRMLNGNFTRDFVGDEKLIIEANYQNISTDDMDTLVALYEDQRDNGNTHLLVINELSISIPVLIDLGSENYTIEECYKYRRINLIFHETQGSLVIS